MRRVVVTGASSEIGLAICRAVFRKGDRLLAHYRSHHDGLESLASSLGGECSLVRADFTKADELEGFCRSIGDVDVLVNGAAVTRTGLLPQTAEGDVRDMLAVNAGAPVAICRAVLPGMVSRRSGCIINISSAAARRGIPGQSVYAGTKGFIESFTRSLAAEYGRRGIRVNCVSPGPIDAGSMKELMAYAGDEVKASVSLGRLGTPDEVGSAVAFLAGEGASFINGVCLAVDGGQLRGL